MVAERYITVFLQGDYHINKYKNIFAAYIHPIIEKFNGTNYKCVTFQDMTEAEYKLPSEKEAKECVKHIRKILTYLSKILLKGKTNVSVMPSYYEKNGARNIVRPDYHMENITLKPISNFSKLKLAKKYKIRDSPPLPASDYCNIVILGNDGTKYVSTVVRKKRNIMTCKWIKA
jgi:hypothetical protein